jgi:hypothetical protein
MSKFRDCLIWAIVIVIIVWFVVLMYFYWMYFLDMIAWVFLKSTEWSVLFK